MRQWLHDKLRDKLSLCRGAHGPCFRKGKRRRQNTAYVDDKRNWIVACDDCFQEIEERWLEMWREVYRSVL